MCGIAGAIAFTDNFAVDADTVTAMATTIAHRGPDDAGAMTGAGIGLAHRRLSIIDLSPAGHQPMPNEDGTVWITYNGEVYNHEKLRPELEAQGPSLPLPDRHRGDRAPLRGGGARVRRAARGNVRAGDLGRPTADTAARPRPRRGQAPLLRQASRRPRLRLRDQGDPRAHPAVRAELDEDAFFDYLTFGFVAAAPDDVRRDREARARRADHRQRRRQPRARDLVDAAAPGACRRGRGRWPTRRWSPRCGGC